MTTFDDGPAKGSSLQLSRSPFLLRVVIDANGTVDALDKLEDQPSATEAIHVYRLANEPGTMHVDRRNPKTGRREGLWMAWATYRLAAIQPPDATARDNQAWQAWAQANHKQA